MRVIDAEAAARPATDRPRRALDIELAGLTAASLVVLFAVVLTSAAKAGRLDEVAPAGGIVPLNALHTPADLEPLLTMYDADSERQFVARALFDRAADPERPLDHVGALAEVRIAAGTIRADRRLGQLGARLAGRPEAREIPALARADLLSLKPRLAVRTVGDFARGLAEAVALFLAAFWLAHLVRRWRLRDDDPLLLPVVMLLSGLGLSTMTALRDPIRDAMIARAFAEGAAIGVALLVAASEFDFESSPLRRAVLAPLAIASGLATLLLVFGGGPGTSGVKVNLFGAQPVEAIRLLVVFALAAYFGRRAELLRELSEPPASPASWLRGLRLPRRQDVQPVLASMALVLTFFFLQRDLGPALVLSCVFLGMYGVARRRAGMIAVGAALLVAGFAAAYWTGVPATVRHRVMIWASPWNNGVAGGSHVAHGLWALSTGGVWGSGPGLGSPTAIPEGHTDFVLAAIGEELGWAGFAAVAALYALLCWRALRIAARAPGDFTTFLAAGAVLVLSVQAIVIAGGLLGLVPLSGVVTPFLSYGRSSMLANCAAIGILLSIARRRSRERAHMRRPLAMLGAAIAFAGAAIVARAAWVQIVRADEIAAASSLGEQADGGYRFEYNPRLLSAARTLTRGTIYDRNGLPLATSRPDEIAGAAAAYERAGAAAPFDCGEAARCYPLGGFAFHLVGDWTRQANWAARNSSYFERDDDARLKGFDDRAQLVDAIDLRTGRRVQAIKRDLRALLPLVRQRYHPAGGEAAALRSRDRDLTTTIDARLQARAAAALRDGITAGGFARGAAVVIDAATGELLAAASYPWPDDRALKGTEPADDNGNRGTQWLDRARYGLYPPGSTFKLVVAGAALRSGEGGNHFMCSRLPGGRVGAFVKGSTRPVRDDPMDSLPHGDVDLDRGLVVSCNAYFAQLALAIGAQAVVDAASLFQISVARPAAGGLRGTLAQVGYGQGEALVTPLKLARVSASIASRGAIVPVRWEGTEADEEPVDRRFLTPRSAERLARAMRAVVTSGTGRSLKSHPVAIAGKTGTAEVSGAPAHAWFTGFAPYGGSSRRIAFAVIVENAGYGGRAAAPIAGAIVTAAHDLGIIR